MKNSLALLIACLLGINSSILHGQPVSSSFLYGGWQFGDYPNADPDKTNLVNALDECGVNFLYWTDPSNQYSHRITAPLIADLGNYTSSHYYLPPKNGDSKYSDLRFFLASDAGDREKGEVIGQTDKPITPFSYDMQNTWSTIDLTYSQFPNKEWHFIQDPNGAGTILLKDLAPNTQFQAGATPYIYAWPLTNAINCDFIFRIDNGVYSGRSDGDHLYEIDYDITYDDNTTASIPSYISYSHNQLTYGDATVWAAEDPNIQLYRGKRYAIIHDVLSSPSGNRIKSLNCTLKQTSYSKDIYVRGLRIRSQEAEDLLLWKNRNQDLRQTFNSYKTSFITMAGAMAWNNTPYFAISGELAPASYQAYAYIDNYFYEHYDHKHLMTFQTKFNNYYWIDAAYRYQVNDKVIPPFYVTEDEGHWNITPDAQNSTNGIIGYPQDIFPSSRTSVTDFTLFGAPIQDYQSYTANYQLRLTQTWLDESLSSLGPNPTNKLTPPAPWLAGIWAQFSFIKPLYGSGTEGSDAIDDSRFRRQGTQLDAPWGSEPSTGFRGLLKNDIKDGICQPQLVVYDLRELVNVDPLTGTDLNMGTTWHVGNPWHVGDPTSLGTLSNPNPAHAAITLPDMSSHAIIYNGNSSQFRLDTRSPTAPELRQDGWNAVAHGAKGLIWNTFLTDGGENIGVTGWGYQHDYDWWNDGSNLSTGNRALFSSLVLGSDDKPLIKLDQWEKFKIQPHLSSGGVDYGNSIQFIEKTGGIWPSCIATDMANLTASTTQSVAQGIVNHYFDNVHGCSGYSGTDTWIPEGFSTDLGNSWAGFLIPNVSASCDCSANGACGGTALWNSFYWAEHKYAPFFAWAPTFYGFKERFTGVTNFGNDLRHCASTLGNLILLNTFSLHDVAAGGSWTDFDNMSPFLHGDIISDKMKRGPDGTHTNFPLVLRTSTDTGDPESGITDATSGSDGDRRLYEFGFFSYKNILYTQKKFAVIVNNRTWPYSLEFVSGTSGPKQVQLNDGGDAKLGAIDAREVFGRVDADLTNGKKWDKVNNKLPTVFVVTDYRNICNPQFVYTHPVGVETDLFSVLLDPGEGTLLSIVPLTSVWNNPCWLKYTPDQVYNNARHVSAREIAFDSIRDYQMTYEKQGGIAVCYPIEGIYDSSLAKRQLATPTDSLIDSTTNCHNPAIAYHGEIPTQFAVVYSMDSTGTGSHLDSTSVIFRVTNDATPYGYGSRVVLDKFKTPSSTYTAATPAITPAKTGCGKWWVSWRNPNSGGKIALLGAIGNIIASKTFCALDPTSTRFISITSQLFRDTAIHTPQSDTCYMAFEEGPRSTGRIYYLEAFCEGGSIDTVGLKDVCIGLPYCENHYPCIAMTPRRRVAITWDALSPRYTWIDSIYTKHSTHYVVLRTRYSDNVWTRFNTLRAFDAVLDPTAIDTLSTFPCEQLASFTQYSPNVWSDQVRLLWNNPFEEQAHVVHLGYWSSHWSTMSENSKLPDASLYPSIPVKTMYDGVLEPVMYIHPTYAEDTTYSNNITIYDMPLSGVAEAYIMQKQFIARPNSTSCGTRLVGGVGQVLVKHDTTSIITDWAIADSVYIDSIVHHVTTWNDSNVRTAPFNLVLGDTLVYGRYFKVGNYHAGDTTALSSYVLGFGDYVKLTVKLRNATTGSLIRILDSCQLTNAGFIQSGSLADSGISKTGFTSTIASPVYMTFEASRGNSSNTFQLSSADCYDDEPFKVDEWPGPVGDTSYKKSDPIIRPQSSIVKNDINLTIHPNPFHTQTEVEVDAPQNIQLNISVFDVMGRSTSTLYNDLSSKDHYSFTLDSKQLNPGMYFVRVQAGSQVMTRKIEMIK